MDYLQGFQSLINIGTSMYTEQKLNISIFSQCIADTSMITNINITGQCVTPGQDVRGPPLTT